MPGGRGGDVSASGAPAVWSRGRLVTGRRAVAEAVTAGAAIEVLVARDVRHTQALRAVLGAADRARVPVREVGRAELDGLARDHRGVVAHVRGDDAAPSALSERDLALRHWSDDAIVVVLDGIEDPQNLGAAARAAEAAGAAAVVSRTRRGAPVTDVAIRASAGALLHLPHARVANISRAIERLQEAGFTVVGLDGETGLSVFAEPAPEGRVALVVGSEGSGLSRLVRERCDRLVALPMRGHVGSLNAAASLAAALYAYVLPRRAGDTA
jgi:23S rRNA (guanosine2251-2'-O)-methyltransferase